MTTIRSSAPRRRAKRGAGRPRVPAGSREALLAAGTELFAERGFDGVSVQAIARKAGVNPAMISYHFGGKRDLYLAILAATFDEIVADVERIAASTAPAPQVLRDVMAAIGMLSGFCGTLTTPMAANFNLVPIALLGIHDRYAIIKAQIPTAVILLMVNTVLMYVFVF